MPFNNAAERALRGIAIGRRNWTFCGSDAGGNRAAAIYTLIETAKLNDVDRLIEGLRRKLKPSRSAGNVPRTAKSGSGEAFHGLTT